MMKLHTPAADQIRVYTICAALNCCVSQLQKLIVRGEVPRADHYQHGRASYWSMATLQAWNPDIARRIAALQAVNQIAA